MNDEYAEYRCSACRKAIKTNVAKCKTCANKLFYHPGCISKHRIQARSGEYVQCKGPFQEFIAESDQEARMKRAPTTIGSGRDRTGSTGSTESFTTPSSGKKESDIDIKIDWIVKAIAEIRNETACKTEIKIMIKELVQEEVGNVKQELDNLKRLVQEITNGPKKGMQRSYCEAVKEKKKENVIIIKPKMQQGSEATKKLIKEKVDIKNMAVGITKFKKGSKGTVIIGCETGEEVKTLKETVQDKLGKNYKVMDSPQLKPKIKIINIDVEELKLDDNELINTIKEQNEINAVNMQIVKRVVKEKRNNQSERRGNEEGSIIMEVDEETHKLILKKPKLNIGWKKCPVFNHINVKRCFKCWGYYHIAKNCTREETCYKCAGNHNSIDCTATKKKCVNCMFKIRTYNLEISDEHDALSPECPTFKRALQKEKRRADWKE